ncbi:hypothetical protein BC332_20692 [Capsicum chinense]|nr:hypothetical protein BC332_20692 [Capsicum chinense]
MEKRSSFFKDDYIDDDDDDDGEMVPPHLIIRRKMGRRMMAFSCCGGYERTLKGRELSHIRNSILRMTGACLVVSGKELRGESGGTPVVMDKEGLIAIALWARVALVGRMLCSINHRKNLSLLGIQIFHIKFQEKKVGIELETFLWRKK